MQFSKFAVYETPYCVWGHDLSDRNLRFLSSVDPDYFTYLAETHVDLLEGKGSHRAAIALRAAYFHGLETFFTLLGATVQAPDCVVGWVQKCQAGDLRSIVRTIGYGHGSLVNKLGMQQFCWEEVSKRINRFNYSDQRRLNETVELFANLWSRLGRDYIDALNIQEYNSIKHGFRLKAGGFKLAVGEEHEYGVPPPPEEMCVLGGSEFGSSFFRAEAVGEHSKGQKDPHFQVRESSLNWNPIALAAALKLIATSINNVVSFAKLVNGIPPKNVLFVRPEESTFFDLPWQDQPPVTSVSIDMIVDPGEIRRFTKNDILSSLEHIQRQQELSQQGE